MIQSVPYPAENDPAASGVVPVDARTEGWRVLIQINRANKRAKQRGLSGRLTRAQWIAIKVRYGRRCLRCGAPERWNQFLTIDHIVPFCRGGANDADSVQPLCYHCNTVKGRQTADYRPDQVVG